MLVADYNNFVAKTDQYKDRPEKERRNIALYGLVGEIGSLVSAVKKQLLAESGAQNWDEPNDEIVEELGDVIWYCFSLTQILNLDRPVNIFRQDIALLKNEIGANNERAKKIHAALDESKREEFLLAAERFPHTKDMCFADYQELAFLTARTDGRNLLEVSLAVLWQLGAELLRHTLPEIELTLNKSVVDRKQNVVLGEIAWHLSAVASLYKLKLDEVVKNNVKKVSFRTIRDHPTPLHDDGLDASQQLPRRFEIAFVSVGPDRARMYYQGVQLGDELTDNSYDEDGYRFHDVMHLANAAFLGWSPVLRGLLRKKRKQYKKIDEVEDGARAMIVEELVIKAIHSEGLHLVSGSDDDSNGPTRLFPTRSHVTFKLLKSLDEFVRGLEAAKNKAWEWEDVIFEGARVFYELRQETQGTVTVDMNARLLSFRPEVCVDIKGVVCGFGASQINLETADISNPSCFLTDAELSVCREPDPASTAEVARLITIKRAILHSLEFQEPTDNEFKQLNVTRLDNYRISVKAVGAIRERMWLHKVIDFKIALTQFQEILGCNALALADPKDSEP